MADKGVIRNQLKDIRARFTKDEIEEKSEAVYQILKKDINWSRQKSLHTYLPIEKYKEVDTWRILRWIWQNYPNIQTSTSVFGESRSLRHCIITEKTKFKVDTLDIPIPISDYEPKVTNYDVIIIPTLGFDAQLNRIGYGLGIYDEFLTSQSDALKIGLSYENCKVEKVSHESHDIKLDMIVTESSTYKL